MLFMGDLMRKRILTFGLFILFIALLRYGSINYEQSVQALTLWFETLVPSLFCVMVLVKMMFACGAFQWLAKPLALLFARLWQMNEQCFPYVAALMLLGFPAGAALVNDAVAHHQLDQKAGQRLINTCSFATPGFVILTVGSVLFQRVTIGVWLYIIQLVSGTILLTLTRRQKIHADHAIVLTPPSGMQALTAAMWESGKTLYMMGGYLMICMSITAILLPFLPACLRMPVQVMAEFSQGTVRLAALSLPLMIRLVAISMLLAFGGFCVHLQVISFSEDTHLRYFPYLGFRLLQAVIAGILAYIVFGLWHMA